MKREKITLYFSTEEEIKLYESIREESYKERKNKNELIKPILYQKYGQ